MLTGDHVSLRAIERDDLSQLMQWRNDPSLRRYFREYRELNAAMQSDWYERIVLADHRTEMFAIVQNQGGRLLGACGLCYIDWLRRSADFSIYIGADGLYLDDRFAPDAARLLMAYAYDELNLHRLWAEVYAIDEPKQAFFRKLGFAQEARFRDAHWTGGAWCDALYFCHLSGDPR
jgi:hypothetical protein